MGKLGGVWCASADDAGADVRGVGDEALGVAAVADGEAVAVDSEANPAGRHVHRQCTGGTQRGGREDSLLGVGLIEEHVDLVLSVGAGHVGGGGVGDAHFLRIGEDGVAEAGRREGALCAEEAAVVDLGLTAHDVDGVFVDLDEVVEGRDEGLDPAVVVETEVCGGLEGLGELDEGLEFLAAVEDFGRNSVEVSFLGFSGHGAVDLFTVYESAIDLADAAGLFAEDGTSSSCHS